MLRSRRLTRPAVRIVPTIIRHTAQTLKKRAAAGQPVTRRTAARVMAGQTRRVLSSPRMCAHALQRNIRAKRAATRTTRRQRPVKG